jgi:predicted phosphodiesterase
VKIALLADIHANYPALLTVSEHLDRWEPDWVFVAGDTVNRGPRPAACLDFVREREREQNWRVIRGNHESYVLWHDRADAPRSGPLFEIFRFAYWTYEKLRPDLPALKAMPRQISQYVAAGGEFRVAHASRYGERRGLYPEMDDATLKQRSAPLPAVFAVGHTHRPFVRRVEDCLIVNAGSVGLPFDGDRRAGYAQISLRDGYWDAEIIRLPYDLGKAKQDFYTTGFLEQAGPLTKLILFELEHAYPQLHRWTKMYMDPIVAGEIDLAQAVQDHLEDPITTPYWKTP